MRVCYLCWESFDATGVQVNYVSASVALRVGDVLFFRITVLV